MRKILQEPLNGIVTALAAAIIKRMEDFEPQVGAEPKTFDAYATVALGGGQGITVKLEIDAFAVAIEIEQLSSSQVQSEPGRS